MSIPGSASPLFFQTAAGAGAALTLQKSVRFNPGDSAYLNRTPSSAGNRRTFTFAFWIKKNYNSSIKRIFSCGPYTAGTGYRSFNITSNGGTPDPFYMWDYSSGYKINLVADAAHRDVAAWYHLVWAVDTTQATESDRVKLYINGTQFTDWQTTGAGAVYPAQNYETGLGLAEEMRIGTRESKTSEFLDGYLADFYYIDGSALDATSFGAFDDNGVWQAAAYSGSFGTNGFHLFDFANESGVGSDSSGNDNDFTANNITNVEANNTDGIDNVVNITQVQNNGTNVDVNLANLQTMMNTSTFQDADTDNSTYGVRVAGTSKKFAVKWSGLTGLTGVSVRWQRAASYDPDVQTSGTGITTATTTLTSGRRQDTFATTSTTGQIVFEDVTTGNTKGFFIRAIEFKGYGSVTYPTNVENFVLSGGADQDVLRDVPTNGSTDDDTGAGGEVSGNYATFNPLMATSEFTYANGNLETSFDAGDNNITVSTIAPKSGKWYAEIVFTASGVTDNFYGEVAVADASKIGQGFNSSTSTRYREGSADIYGAGTATGTKSDFAVGDVMGVAVDADNDTVYFYKNNTLEGTVTGLNFDGYAIGVAGNSGTNRTFTAAVNFGQRSWVYSAPSGYKALCTTNLPTPTIADGSAHFDIKLWTGNGSTQNITGYSFSPDLVYTKQRNSTGFPALFDPIRGVHNALRTHSDGGTYTDNGLLTAFNSDGFSVGSAGDINGNNNTYVGWAWDAGSSTASNTDGSITTSVRANQTAGFSIVSYTGTGANATIGHGLNAAPEFAIFKARNGTNHWLVYHKSLGNGKKVNLNLTDAASSSSTFFQNTDPTSSVMYLGTESSGNWSGYNMIGYLFSGVAGYSAFGSYEGNGSSDGPFVFLNFRPALVIYKNVDTGYGWQIYDSTRDSFNICDNRLQPSSSNAEDTTESFDMLSNGFKIRTSHARTNNSGDTFIFAAFAENPFQANGGLAR